jgi:hypothetical protein
MRNGDITNYFVDSLNNETPTGERWRQIRDEWKTDTMGYLDESGKIKFNGFQGQYMFGISCYTDTFYLEPGESTKTIIVSYGAETAVDYTPSSLKTTKILIDGITAPIKLPVHYSKQLFLTTWSLSGQQLSRSPVNPSAGNYIVQTATPSCRVFRIETAERVPLCTGKITPVR